MNIGSRYHEERAMHLQLRSAMRVLAGGLPMALSGGVVRGMSGTVGLGNIK